MLFDSFAGILHSGNDVHAICGGEGWQLFFVFFFVEFKGWMGFNERFNLI